MRKTKGLAGVSLKLGILAGLPLLAGLLYLAAYEGLPLRGERDALARFQKNCREYDLLFEASKEDRYLRNYSVLETKLIALEKQNNDQAFASLQTTLSLLKRERAFSRYERNFRPRYEKNLLAAGEKYPPSVQLQALLFEHALQDGASAMPDALRAMRPADGASGTRAAAAFFSAMTELYEGKDKEAMLVNAALLTLLDGGAYRDTAAALYPLDLPGAASVNTFRFAAEYAYDAGDFALASRLFAALPSAAALQRSGDALFLAGDRDGARAMWRLSSNTTSLYNHALLSNDEGEQRAALEEALAAASENPPQRAYTAALTLYTRLLDEERAAAVLQESPFTTQSPLLDLELWRRTERRYPPERALAEMWRLLGRHRQSPELYEYAARYFGKERQYEELALLLKNAALQNIDTAPLAYWRAVLLAREPGGQSAREAFAALPYEPALRPWYVSANAGRLYEAERAYGRAVEHYAIALAAAPDDRDKARIARRMAACLTAQGKDGAAREALERAARFE
jgi:tetratricopeptide (TPR) repeat protein